MTGVRVLVLTSLFPPRPGDKQGNFVLDQARELAEQGADATVMVAQPWAPGPLRFLVSESKRPLDLSRYAAEAFSLVTASFFSLPRYALGTRAAKFVAGLVPTIRALHEKSGFELIHAHGILLGHAAVAAAAELCIPSVVSIHGIETSPRFDNSQAKRDQIGRMLEKADKVLLVGSPLLEYVRRYTTRTDHCAIVGNGFTTYPGLQPSSRIPRSRPVRVIAVSRYEPSKGFELLMEAIASLEPNIRDQIETVLVGGGEGFREVLSRANELGIGTHVRHAGPVPSSNEERRTINEERLPEEKRRSENREHFQGLPHRETLSEILASDIFCLPSWRESFGIMYAEAMSLGKFTIGCDGQGPSDFIRHMETGYLIAPRSVRAVAEALRWAVLHPEEREQIAGTGRTFAGGHLTWRHNASRILNIYRDLLTTKAKAG